MKAWTVSQHTDQKGQGDTKHPPPAQLGYLRLFPLHFELRRPEQAGDVGPQHAILLGQAVPLRAQQKCSK